MRRREAAVRVGVHERTASDWDRGIRQIAHARLHPDGRRIDYKTGVTTINNVGLEPSLAAVEAQLHPRFLTLAEREQIADLRRAGKLLRAIGRALGRSASTIKREIDARSAEGVYRPHRAQRAWAKSRPRPKQSKLAQDGRLRDYVADRLQQRWSPEQICHALVIEFPDDEGMRAEEVRDVLISLVQTLPEHLRGSLAWDQGCEMAAHKQFTVATGVPVYFCGPHSPWQRGSNENTNGLLRQYFPKGTDLSLHSAADLEHVGQQLNGRPRKTLGWKTPAERLRDLLTTTPRIRQADGAFSRQGVTAGSSDRGMSTGVRSRSRHHR